MSCLSVTRAADRREMASRLIGVVEAHGGTAKIDEEMCQGRNVWVDVRAPGGLGLTMDFWADGKNQQTDVWVLPWFVETDSINRLAFAAFPHGSVNAHHQHKATGLAHSFDGMLAEVSRVVELATNGSLYEPEVAA